MSSNDLCNLLNDFYEDISPDVVQSVFSAIKAGEDNLEFESLDLYNAFRFLIFNLANHQMDESVSVNIYMRNNNTRWSSTRPFFYHMTLLENLYPEDVPLAPTVDLQLDFQRAALVLSQTHHIPLTPLTPLTTFPLPFQPFSSVPSEDIEYFYE